MSQDLLKWANEQLIIYPAPTDVAFRNLAAPVQLPAPPPVVTTVTAKIFRAAIDKVIGDNYALYTDYMPWYGTPGEIHKANYSSLDAGVMDAQLDAMQACGIDGVRVTYMGANPKVGPFGHKVVMALAAKVAARKMRFMFLIDPWCVKNFAQEGFKSKEEALISTLKFPEVQAVLNGPAYVDKYVMEFSTGVNPQAIEAAIPGFTVGSWHTHYSWPNIKQNPDGSISGWDRAGLQADNRKASLVMPGVFGSFFDGGFVTNKAAYLASVAAGKPIEIARDYSKSVWPGATPDVSQGPARFIAENAGRTFIDSVADLALCPTKPKIVSLITWNDWDEGTTFEGRASQATGIDIGAKTV